MALVRCPECGREGVSDQAKACPGCGFDLYHFYKEKRSRETALKDTAVDNAEEEISEPQGDTEEGKASESSRASEEGKRAESSQSFEEEETAESSQTSEEEKEQIFQGNLPGIRAIPVCMAGGMLLGALIGRPFGLTVIGLGLGCGVGTIIGMGILLVVLQKNFPKKK